MSSDYELTHFETEQEKTRLSMWRETNQLLGRIASALEELARQHSDLNADAEREAMDPKELARSDAMTLETEEMIAALEALEDEGVPVPAASYHALGLESPRRGEDPVIENEEAEGLEAGRPEDGEPKTARRVE